MPLDRDEGFEYAARLGEEGVPVHLSEYEGMIHGFVRMAALIDRTRGLLDEVAGAARAALTGD
jgi:acetyl esterase